jgi:hypothetical protein
VKKSTEPGTVIGAVAAIVAAVIGAAVSLYIYFHDSDPLPPRCDIPAEQALGACFDTPDPDEEVPEEFTISGKLKGIPAESYVWAVVEVQNLMWPKGSLTGLGPAFNMTVFQDAKTPNNTFNLRLIVVGEESNQTITTWLSNGDRSGQYPPLEPRAIPDFQTIAVVPDLHTS